MAYGLTAVAVSNYCRVAIPAPLMIIDVQVYCIFHDRVVYGVAVNCSRHFVRCALGLIQSDAHGSYIVLYRIHGRTLGVVHFQCRVKP